MIARGAIRMRSRSATVPARDADETSAPSSASPMTPVTPAPVGVLRSDSLWSGRPAPVRAEHAPRVRDDDVADPGRTRIDDTATPAAPAPDTTTVRSARRLSTTFDCVVQRGQGHDRRAVLVVVKDGDVQALLEATLDLEAPRRRDVLEVDAAVGRRDSRDRVDDLVDRAGLHAHRDGIDVGEVLEEHGLALHHGHRCERSDGPEAEHGGAVADDGDGVAPARVDGGQGGVGCDGPGDLRDARRVEQGEVGCVAQLGRGVYPELAALVAPGRPGRSGRRAGWWATHSWLEHLVRVEREKGRRPDWNGTVPGSGLLVQLSRNGGYPKPPSAASDDADDTCRRKSLWNASPRASPEIGATRCRWLG